MPSYFCLITVLGDGSGIQPPQPPLGIWGPTDPRPGYGLPGSQPRPDQGLPGYQPYPDQGLPGHQPYPDNTLPGQPPRPWGPIHYPDQGLPGRPPGQIWGPTDPRPTPPIYIPPPGSPPPLGIWGPTDPRPGYGLPGSQPHPDNTLPGGQGGRPTHPIVLPPDLPPELPSVGKIEWKTAWTPITGWVIVGVPAEGTLVPTPS